MGVKLTEGAHTRVPVSPPDEPRNEAAGPEGNWTTHKGYTFNWDPDQGLYKCRIPEPDGEWVFVEFAEGESYDEYSAHQSGSDLWTETGKDYANGG